MIKHTIRSVCYIPIVRYFSIGFNSLSCSFMLMKLKHQHLKSCSIENILSCINLASSKISCQS